MTQIMKFAVAVALLGAAIGAQAEAKPDLDAELASIEAASRSAAQTATNEILRAVINSGRVAFEIPSRLVASTNIWAWHAADFSPAKNTIFVSVSESRSGMRYATFFEVDHTDRVRKIVKSGLVCDDKVDAPYERVADICLEPATVPSLHWAAR